MKKKEQLLINQTVKERWDETMNAIASREVSYRKTEKLYSCTAQIEFYDSGFCVLRSYDTLIALYDMETETIYDALRYVYGFTSTSAQHVAKFRNWLRERYRLGWDEIKELRYYPIG